MSCLFVCLFVVCVFVVLQSAEERGLSGTEFKNPGEPHIHVNMIKGLNSDNDTQHGCLLKEKD